MDWASNILGWISENESALSGIAATMAIVAVVFAFGSRTLGFLRPSSQAIDHPKPEGKKIVQEIRYCRTPNGNRIAWSTTGSGYPLIRSLGWFTNLETEWASPVFSPFWQELSSRFELIRYDGRGMGMSDRNIVDFSPKTRLEDLEAVIEAAGVDKIALMGISEGGATALSYAAKHPDRVSHLVIWGSFLLAPTFEDVPQFGAIARLVPDNWGGDSPGFHQMFAAMFLPDGNAEQNAASREMQRTSATAETAAAFMRTIGDPNAMELATQVNVPAIVIHRKGDLAVPVRFGQEFAAQLPNARMILLEGNNHLLMDDREDIKYTADLIDDFVSGANSG